MVRFSETCKRKPLYIIYFKNKGSPDFVNYTSLIEAVKEWSFITGPNVQGKCTVE